MRAPRTRAPLALLLLIVATVIAAMLSLSIGAVSLDLGAIAHALVEPLGYGQASPRDVAIIWSLRVPRTVLALVIGAMLATSGAAMQGLFKNPLADPGLVGVSSGAALGAGIFIVLGASIAASTGYVLPSAVALPSFAFIGSAIVTLLVLRIGRLHGRGSAALMLLAGVAINALVGAVQGILIYVSTEEELRDLTFWLLGTLAASTEKSVAWAAPVMLLAMVLLVRMARAFDLLLLGDTEAGHLGLDVHKAQRRAILLVAVGVGASVAAIGMVSFVGLVVPHMVRLAIGPGHRRLLPLSALGGAVLLVGADLIARTIVEPSELPLGIVTAFVGAPFFLYLLIRQRDQMAVL